MPNFSKVLQGNLPQLQILNYKQEDTPLLMSMEAIPANAGAKHLYKEFVEATPLKQVDWNEKFPAVTSQFTEDFAEVNRFGGEQNVTRDDALKLAESPSVNQPGSLAAGVNAWFDNETPYIARETMMDLEKATIYSVKRGLLASSKTFETMTGVAASDAGDIYYSLVVVAPSRHTTLLYDETFYRDNGFFSETLLNSSGPDGEPVPTKNKTTEVLEVGKLMETSLGSLFVNPREITSIVNFTLDDIDASFHKLLNQKIAKCRGTNKKIYAHPDVINALLEAQEAKTYSVGNPSAGATAGTDNLVHVDMWRSTEMIGSYNFLEGEEPFQTGL